MRTRAVWIAAGVAAAIALRLAVPATAKVSTVLEAVSRGLCSDEAGAAHPRKLDLVQTIVLGEGDSLKITELTAINGTESDRPAGEERTGGLGPPQKFRKPDALAIDGAQCRRMKPRRRSTRGSSPSGDGERWSIKLRSGPRFGSRTGKVVCLDVDLPEIEDLPQTKAVLSKTGKRLLIKKLPASEGRKLYARHIHGIVLRLLGEVFGTLPKVEEAVVSGYSQRLDPSTGRESDEYLLSVRASRESLARIDFSALSKVDPVEALATFDCRRKMTKTGVFRPIEPFEYRTE